MEIREAWLAQVEEVILEPERPIVDPHHHFFDEVVGFPPYDLDDLWRDQGGDPAQRDSAGFRVRPDGARMVFYLDYCAFTGIGPAQFVVDDWARVGVRVIPRERARSLFYQEKAANKRTAIPTRST